MKNASLPFPSLWGIYCVLLLSEMGIWGPGPKQHASAIWQHFLLHRVPDPREKGSEVPDKPSYHAQGPSSNKTSSHRITSLLRWVNRDLLLIHTYLVCSCLIRNMKEVCCRKDRRWFQLPTIPLFGEDRSLAFYLFLLGTIAVTVSIHNTQLCIYWFFSFKPSLLFSIDESSKYKRMRRSNPI